LDTLRPPQLREDNALPLAEAVFGAPIVLQNKFLQGDNISVENFLKNLWILLRFLCPDTI
jgi:hypothetical protein